MKKPPLIILTGPTAVGKTKLSIALAKAIGGAIISADSMQVYRHMDIGSAKVTLEEQENIPHYLIDVLDPQEAFHVVRFQEMAKEALKEIYAKGQIPIVVGGTGFYIQALLYDIDFTENNDNGPLRKELETLAREKGPDALYAMLLEKDPVAAKEIHPHNTKRIIRALEYFSLNQAPISKHNAQQRQKESPYRFCYFVVTDERELLYQRINERVEEMMQAGLVDEVKGLKERGCEKSMVSMQGLGYKEILAYLDGEGSLEEAVYQIKIGTRHFAKRQLTWFRREREVTWVDKQIIGSEPENLLQYVLNVLKEKEIIS